jgi:glycosyltransferase involved in cell wall biosynthesis
MTTASVLIATFNRAALLDECLQHLARQSFASGDEVLIADNGSTDRTADVVARHAATFPVPLIRLSVPTPGKSHAVAAALRAASAEIVAFTDDDVEVGPEWLPALKQAFAEPTIGLAGGPVAPRWERPAPSWLQLTQRSRLGAPLGLLDYGDVDAPLGSRTLLGANMAVRRSVLDQVGGYAVHLGKLRGTLLSGEDHELCQRIQAAGFGARFVAAARVRHWVPADRMRIGYFLDWFYWSGITHAAMDADPGGDSPVLSMPYLVRQFAAGVVGAAAYAATGRLPAAIDRLLDSAFAVGYAVRRAGLAQVGAAPAAPSVARGV